MLRAEPVGLSPRRCNVIVMYKRVRRMTLVPAVAAAAVLAGCSTVGDLGDEVGAPTAVETTDSTVASTTSLPEGADPSDGGLPLPDDTTTTSSAPEDTTTTTAGTTDTTAPTADDPAAVAAVTAAAVTVFDLTVPWAEKAPFIEDSDDLEATHETFVQVATSFGDIAFAVDDVAASGSSATFAFDVMVNGVPFRSDLPGEAVLTGDTWQVTRATFCDALADTAVTCPA
jgi:hypothetical protein